jgi:tetratricopeptide (TPR) repeat protein
MRRADTTWLVAAVALFIIGATAAIAAQISAADVPRTLCSRCARLLQAAVESYGEGNLRDATARLRQAVRHHPQEGKLQFLLGNALYRGGHLRQAAIAYERALLIEPHQLETLVSAGFTRYELGDASAAVGLWESAVSLSPSEPLSRAALAVGYSTLARAPEAIDQYEIAVRLDPRYGEPDALAVDIRWKPKALGVLRGLRERLPDGTRRAQRRAKEEPCW